MDDLSVDVIRAGVWRIKLSGGMDITCVLLDIVLEIRNPFQYQFQYTNRYKNAIVEIRRSYLHIYTRTLYSGKDGILGILILKCPPQNPSGVRVPEKPLLKTYCIWVFWDVSSYKSIPGLFSNDNQNWVHMGFFFRQAHIYPSRLLSTGFRCRMDWLWCKKIIRLHVLITHHAVYIPVLLLLLHVYNKALTPFKRFL